MNTLRKSVLKKNTKQTSVHPKYGNKPSSNRVDSNKDLVSKKNTNIAHIKTSCRPTSKASNSSINPFEGDKENHQTSTSFNSHNLAEKNEYKNLQDHVACIAEDTTNNVNNCLKIAEMIRDDATKTLLLLHKQGEQITKTHTVAAEMDIDLTRSEKLLGSLGGTFSRTWKPTKGRKIKGPVITKGDPVRRKGDHLRQRERLGLGPAHKGRSNMRTLFAKSTDITDKVKLEKAKQDNVLSDLSNMLDDLKDMAIDMGSEIDRQNKGLNPFLEDVKELNFRVKVANQRGRRLLAK